jgi:acetoin utilization deacetylase AcuC-like enzyme
MTPNPANINIFWHPAVLNHNTGRGFFQRPPSPFLEVTEQHPESPDRLRNMHAVLQHGPLKSYGHWHDGRYATLEELQAFHDPEYLDMLQDVERAGGKRLAPTTVIAPGSLDAARAAAGTTLAAMNYILEGPDHLAYALVRPPGHHAAPAQADGYCLFNNIGVAVEHALKRGVARVAVIDWDVHHGNGTQEGFYDRGDVLTVSLHMDHGAWGPSHPQTGKVDEIGRGAGIGFNVNVPLPMGIGDDGYNYAMTELVLPEIEAFAPELLVVASGQDASQFDPNGRQLLTMVGFRLLGRHARALADAYCDGRLLLVQEGGYALSYAAYCLHATLEGVLGVDPLLDDPIAYLPEDVTAAITAVDIIHNTRTASLDAAK